MAGSFWDHDIWSFFLGSQGSLSGEEVNLLFVAQGRNYDWKCLSAWTVEGLTIHITIRSFIHSLNSPCSRHWDDRTEQN